MKKGALHIAAHPFVVLGEDQPSASADMTSSR